MAGPYMRLLAEHEGAAADLYDCLAETLPRAGKFWKTLAGEEMEHRRMVMGIEDKLMDGEWLFKRPAFLTIAIVESLDWIALQKKTAQAKGISMRSALKLALELEDSMIESGFFRVLDNDSPRMMDVLETMETYSKAHMHRLQREARRFKWRLFGGRKVRMKSAGKSSAATDIRESLKSQQSKMLGLLISLEEAASRLYTAYSERLLASKQFWARLAAEEMQHAAMLRGMYKLLDNGHIFTNLDRFRDDVIQADIHFILNAEFDARHGQLSFRKAVNTALAMERTMTDSRFYSTVECGAPEFRIIAERLIVLTEQHIKRIDDETARVISMGRAAADDVPLPE